MREYLQRFMIGRYGQDQLNRFISVAALVVMILSLFIGRSVLYPLAVALLILCFFRMFSKNIVSRRRENQYYLLLHSKVTRRAAGRMDRYKQRKTYNFYRCPSCQTQLRVPKGRGRISITCPKCRTSFEKKT